MPSLAYVMLALSRVLLVIVTYREESDLVRRRVVFDVLRRRISVVRQGERKLRTKVILVLNSVRVVAARSYASWAMVVKLKKGRERGIAYICVRPFVCISFATVRLYVKVTVAFGLHQVATYDA